MKKYLKLILTVSIVLIGAFAIKFLLKKQCSHKKCSDSKENDTILINVLDKELFEDAHITGSTNIPFDDFDTSMFTDKDKTYIFYCSNSLCTASHDAARALKKKDFNNVYVYSGGMADWYQHHQNSSQEFPITGPAQESYLKVIFPLKKQSKSEKYTEISSDDLQQMLKTANIITV